MVTSVQRFGGAVNLHVHFHTLVLDGVFVRDPDGTLSFHPAAPPTDEAVRRVVARVRRRLERLGLAGLTVTEEDADSLADESVALAGLCQAAVLGRAALGRRAGRGPLRIGADPDAPWVDRHGPLHAHEAGFDLHAAVHVSAGDRPRLERLCQYLVRPPLGQHRVHRLRDGRIAVALQRPWADGTTHLVFTPAELLARLVPLVPRPRINLLLYHEVLAPNAPWRAPRAVHGGRGAIEGSGATVGRGVARVASRPRSSPFTRRPDGRLRSRGAREPPRTASGGFRLGVVRPAPAGACGGGGCRGVRGGGVPSPSEAYPDYPHAAGPRL